MTTTFITGANRGLGYETARRLSELGHTVLLGARDRERGAAAAAELGVRFVPIDVTDDASCAAAAADVAAHEGILDLLINNAGVPGPYGDPSAVTADDALAVYDVNVFGVIRVTAAFLPLLQKSADPAIINISSGMGSLSLTHDPDRDESKVVVPLYTSSKAALTMLTTQYAKALPGIRINAVDPGYTATEFNGYSGPQTVTEGTDAVVALATAGAGAPTGRFVSRHGEMAWD
ncbi:short-subunit dehydrogenase [Motilibacter rhizosphaerae]|uniref:Short-subunit dehydrogenase n=1 Tax=Motilibacter rhizosphaerae TaxID=598652 RepID=A0A4Q7NWA5_9ACTN|nr:SDR family NAD(P)-dependent oxidoreductase [Motilibacter rhizosphaerae]RZS91561.1 short-subunit dehydrogenase [Motilibacter rhizosphaerae]